jgi:uncharacterized membrane protein
MDFKACIEIKTNCIDHIPEHGVPSQRHVEAVLIPFFLKWSVYCNKNIFYYHKTEYDEASGIYFVGIEYKFHRSLQCMSSYCAFVKIFEGIVSLMEAVYRTEGIRVYFSC